jgi:hypothetical protein
MKKNKIILGLFLLVSSILFAQDLIWKKSISGSNDNNPINSNTSIDTVNNYIEAIPYEKGYLIKICNSSGEDETINETKLAYILKKDIFGYFELSGYDSELKKKVFLESEKSISYQKQINNLYSSVFNKEYYTAFKFKYYAAYDFGLENYDLHTKTFEISHVIYGYDYYNFGNYIVTKPSMCFRFPISIPIITKIDSGSNEPAFIETFKIPIVDEKLALEIENNKDDCCLIFKYKLKYATEKPTILFSETFILCDINEIIIKNNKSGEIYFKVPIKQDLKNKPQIRRTQSRKIAKL